MEPQNNSRFNQTWWTSRPSSLIVCLNHSFLVVTIPTFANVWAQNPLIFHDLQAKLQQLFMLIGNVVPLLLFSFFSPDSFSGNLYPK